MKSKHALHVVRTFSLEPTVCEQASQIISSWNEFSIVPTYLLSCLWKILISRTDCWTRELDFFIMPHKLSASVSNRRCPIPCNWVPLLGKWIIYFERVWGNSLERQYMPQNTTDVSTTWDEKPFGYQDTFIFIIREWPFAFLICEQVRMTMVKFGSWTLVLKGLCSSAMSRFRTRNIESSLATGWAVLDVWTKWNRYRQGQGMDWLQLRG